MPSIWTLTLRGLNQRYLLPTPFHGMVSHWLAHDENPARFSAHYQSIGPRTAMVTIRVLDDSLEPAVEAIPRTHHAPSGQPDKDASRIQGWAITSGPTLAARYSWADLLEVPEPVHRAWRISLVTPMAWSKNPARRTTLGPDRMLHSAKDHWAKLDATYGRSSCPIPHGGIFPRLSIRDPRLTQVDRASLESAPHALVGHLDIVAHTERDARITQQLLNFASLAGLGVQRTWGLGAVEVTAIPPRSAPNPYGSRAGRDTARAS